MEVVFLLLANALLLAAPVTECVPVRWPSADPASLQVLGQSSLNCLMLEEAEWQRGFADAAHGRGLRLMGVVRDGRAAKAEKAMAAGLDGVVAEGAPSLELREWAVKSGKPLVELVPRSSLSLKDPPAVAGTTGSSGKRWSRGMRRRRKAGRGFGKRCSSMKNSARCACFRIGAVWPWWRTSPMAR